MKAFITVSLATGIIEKEGDAKGNLFKVATGPQTLNEYYHGEGKEWHRTRWDAVVRMRRMRDQRVRSLEKSLVKLRTMEIN